MWSPGSSVPSAANMRPREFRSRRQWSNLSAWAWIAPFLVLAALLVSLRMNRFWPLWTSLGIALVGAAVALVRDMGREAVYLLNDRSLTLRNAKGELVLPTADMIDASPIDRVGARSYLEQYYHQKLAAEGELVADRAKKAFTEYCSVDIGLRSFSFGMGRRFIDRMPGARLDLVLLRTKEMDVILSPQQDRGLVDAINRLFRERQA